MIARRRDGKSPSLVISKEPGTTHEWTRRLLWPQSACEATAARLPQGGTGSFSGGMWRIL